MKTKFVRPLIISSLITLLISSNAFAQNAFTKKLSRNHLLHGASQFWAGNIPISRDVMIKLWNPNSIDYVTASFFYESERSESGELANSEVFVGCAVRLLTPHGSRTSGAFFTQATGAPLYAETIAAPLNAQTVSGSATPTRLADGFGIGAESARKGERAYPVNPIVWSLPSDSVVPGQKQDSVDCVCALIQLLNIQNAGLKVIASDTFEEFGVDGFDCAD